MSVALCNNAVMRVLVILIFLFLASLGLAKFVFTQPEQRLYKQASILAAVVFAAIFTFILGLSLIHRTI